MNIVALRCLKTDFGNTSARLATAFLSGAFRPQLIVIFILGVISRGSFVTCEYLREGRANCTNGSLPSPVFVVSGLSLGPTPPSPKVMLTGMARSWELCTSARPPHTPGTSSCWGKSPCPLSDLLGVVCEVLSRALVLDASWRRWPCCAQE